MLFAVVPFLAPLLFVLWGAAEPAPRRGAALGAGGRRALPVRPEAVRGPSGAGRVLDGGLRLGEELGPAVLMEPLTSPAEYGLSGWRRGPGACWDGVYPGTGAVILVGGAGGSGSSTRRGLEGSRATRPPLPRPSCPGACSPVLAGLMGAVPRP